MTNDSTDGEKLLQALGALATERRNAVDDERWEDLTHERLTQEEVDELRRRAETNDEWAFNLAVFEPLDPGLADEIVGAVEAAKPKRRRPGRRRVFWGSLAAAAAAFVAVVLYWHEQTWHGQSPLLPDYVATVAGGDSKTRSGAPGQRGPDAVSPGTVLSIKLSPRAPVRQRVVARGFVLRGLSLQNMTADPMAELDGSFTLRGPASELLGTREPGLIEMVFVVARPDDLPVDATAVRTALAKGHSDWRLVRAPVRLVPGG